MNYFVFRNYTCEGFFPKGYEFSGYDDFYFIPKNVANLIWFYQCPIKSSKNAILSEIQEYKARIDTILTKKSTTTTFVYFSTEIIEQIHFDTSAYEIRDELATLNTAMYQRSLQDNSIKFIDFSTFLRAYLPIDRIDWKYFYYSQSIINPKLKRAFQEWWQIKQNALYSKRKKCLILDLDNTLWQGVLGEDGIYGIKCGKDYPGICFHDFQLAIAEAAKNGVILAVCSKNNEADVLEAWQKNTDIIVKNDLLAAYRINWKSKAENIQEIADELNIGLDSMIFLDDNPIEREQVKALIPDVIVPDFPEKPYMLWSFFQEVYQKHFILDIPTQEDSRKVEQYQANSQRHTFKRNFENIDDYLSSLNMELHIRNADTQTIPRIAQMTQKTNQFNLTTPRYSEQEIQKFAENGHLVVTLGVKDKFGDNGITVLSIITIDKKTSTAAINTFLLSCRILGRGIESAFLQYLENYLFSLNIDNLKANYIPTSKNKQTIDFYEKNNFTLISEIENGEKLYQKKLNQVHQIKSYYQFIIN